MTWEPARKSHRNLKIVMRPEVFTASNLPLTQQTQFSSLYIPSGMYKSGVSTEMVKRDPEQTRQNILAAAFEEVHGNGFRGASLERILADTGLTKGALYHHFPNKDALGHALIDETLREMIC